MKAGKTKYCRNGNLQLICLNFHRIVGSHIKHKFNNCMVMRKTKPKDVKITYINLFGELLSLLVLLLRYHYNYYEYQFISY